MADSNWEQVAALLADLRETCKSHDISPADWMTALITELMTVAMSIDDKTAEETIIKAIQAYVVDYRAERLHGECTLKCAPECPAQ